MNPISILYLEDSPIDMDLSLSLLRSEGIHHEAHRVETKESFQAALEERCYHLILADYALPEFDGRTALELAQKQCPETPFVFVSGAIGEEFAIESLHRGATDYVLKQRLRRLAPAVRRALLEAEERRARQRAEAEREELLAKEQAARTEAETRARELTQVNAELEQFAFAASHDLQEPLRGVKIYSQMLVRRCRPALDEEMLQFIDHIEDGVTRMEKLIQGLLLYSRTIHCAETRFQPVALEPIFRQTLSDFRQAIEESGAIVSCDPLPTVVADAERIAQVFQNLLSNSLKYRRTQAPQIHVSARQAGHEHWIVSLRDNGIGFDEQYSDQIFGLFKRLHRNEYPGTGVGLALAKKIVEQHGGRIWAEGRPGQGAIFSFTLPSSTALPAAGCSGTL